MTAWEDDATAAGLGKASSQTVKISSENEVIFSDQEIDTFRKEMNENGELNGLELRITSLKHVAGSTSNPPQKVKRKIWQGFTMVEVVIASVLMPLQ